MSINNQLDILHDSLLYGLFFIGHTVELYFIETYKTFPKKFKITLGGVEYLIADEFREGNIVLDIRLFPVEQLNDDICLKLISHDKNRIQERKKIFRNMNIFNLNCSYGCELYALYDTIVIDEIVDGKTLEASDPMPLIYNEKIK